MKQLFLFIFLLSYSCLSAQKVGVNILVPEHTLDVRSNSIGAAAQLNISNLDKSRYLRFFSGSNMFPDPSITLSPGKNLLFASFDDVTLAFNEYMRIEPSGNVGIGTQNPDDSAILDLSSDGKGVLIPRLTSTQISQISNPQFSLLVYQTDVSPGFYYNSGTSIQPVWKKIGDDPPSQGRFSQNYAPGNTNFIVPVGVTRIYFEMVAGGGGVGGTYLVTSGANRGGGGGGGGGFASGYIDVTPGEVLALTVGAKGTNGSSGTPGNNGTDGESSSISSGATTLIRTTGGAQGNSATSSQAGSGGAGGTITQVNSTRVKLTCNIWAAVAGRSGVTTDAVDLLNISGVAGCVNNPGNFNRLHIFESSVFIGGSPTAIAPSSRTLPYYGIGGGRNHGAQGGYIVLNW